MKYKVDVVRIRENSITLNGWALGKSPESKVTFRVEDEHHQPVKCKMVSTRRDDVSQIYFKKVIDREFGFDIQFPYERGKSYWLLIRCDGRQAKIKYNEELITKRASVAHKRMEKIKDLMNMETVHVALDFWKENGLRALIKKSCHKIQGLDNDYDYGEWYDLTKPTEEDLKAQRETHFEYEPLFSVVIPVYNTPERYLKEMLDSILDQTYGQWEVCIADGSPRGQDVEKVLKKYAEKDPRIHYEILGGNRGIAGNTNGALSMAAGDFVILADHDDTIPPQAFYEVAKAINKHPDCDVLYSDEDKLDMEYLGRRIRYSGECNIRKVGEHIVSRLELDSNRHLNNSEYIKIALATIADFNPSSVTRLCIEYRKQAVEGDLLNIFLAREDEMIIDIRSDSGESFAVMKLFVKGGNARTISTC